VDTRVRDQVGLELVQVHVQSTIEPQRRGNRRDNLGDKTVQVLVAWSGNIQIPAADVVDSLIVNQERTVRVLDGAMSGENGVIGFNNGRRETRCRVDGEFQLALLPIVGRETFEEQSPETGPSTTAEGVED
jgi:hypothetical protein